ncbi:hypothetical protein Tco_0026366 [Tanacetum coccineum]
MDGKKIAIKLNCDVKANKYHSSWNFHRGLCTWLSIIGIAKELWERIQLLMQGTSLTKQERECKLYDEFNKFAYKKGETLRDFYLRFSLLLNDMNIYNVKLEPVSIENTNVLDTLPPEWSKFMTNVKLGIDKARAALPAAASPTGDSPGYVPESDFKEDLEEDNDEDPADYPADGGDDGDDEDESSDDDEVDAC